MRGGPRKWEAQALVHCKNGQRHLLLPVFSHSFFLRPPLTPVTPRLPPVPPPLRPNASRRWFFFVLSTCHPPPPSHPITSWRWCFSFFRHVSRHHHLPRIQTRAGGGFFRLFHHVSCHHHLPRVQTRAGGGVFNSFATSPATTTSLASKREPEVVFFRCFFLLWLG